MLSANTEPPVPVIMGLLGTTLSSPLRLFDGLGLSNLGYLSRRQKASWRSEKFLSGRCWAVATAVKDSTVRMHNCDAASVPCKLGSVAVHHFFPEGAQLVETCWKEAFLSSACCCWHGAGWQLILMDSKGTKPVVLCSSPWDAVLFPVGFLQGSRFFPNAIPSLW